MKRGKIVIGIVIIIIVLAAVIIFGLYTPPIFQKDTKHPAAKIEINRSSHQDVIIHQGEEIFFSAKNSSDEDGEIEQYLWNFGDGSSSKSMNAKHTYDEPGTYNVTLTVVDDDGNKDIQYLEIKVNSLPVAMAQIVDFTGSGTITVPIAKQILFNSSGSYDSDGQIVGYHWDFGDGNQSSMESPEYYYFNIGTYKVTLTVIDDVGAMATDQLEINIILRSYASEWTLKYEEIIIEENGYTRESQSSSLLRELYKENIAQINVTLNWTDRQPLLMNNQSAGEDLFELQTITPENLSRNENSTSGNITIRFTYNSQPAVKEFKAKTKSDALSMAIDDAALTDEGNGEWYFNISAIECKGGNWINDEFDMDIGNFWTLTVLIWFFELEMYEVTE
ncbi:PKD domain-containing protein [[Eubacterium] cellulosolvens]